MFRKPASRLGRSQLASVLLVVVLITAGIFHSAGYGDQLPERSLKLDNGLAGKTDTYQLQFTLPNSETLGSIKLEFCSESPLVGTTCTPPVGQNVATATLASQSGTADMTISGASTNNVIILTRPPANIAAGVLTYTFTTVSNPTNAGTYFARIQTYPTNDASGASTDQGGIAFAVNGNLTLSATVPPFLYFCVGVSITDEDCSTVTGDYINLGELTSLVATTAETQMVAATNADTGYTIFAGGTTLTSGNNIIPALTTSDVSRPGTSQFGINLVANTDPAVGENPVGGSNGTPTANYDQPNLYRFVPGEFIAGSPVPDERRKYTTSYIVNISKTQPAGVYVSTITYVATGGF